MALKSKFIKLLIEQFTIRKIDTRRDNKITSLMISITDGSSGEATELEESLKNLIS